MWAVRLAQRVIRGMIARQAARKVRKIFAAVKIQKLFRGYCCWQKFQKFLSAVTIIQSHYRQIRAVKHYSMIRSNIAAIKIQRNILRWYYYVRWNKFKYSVIVIQNLLRGRKAKVILKRLRLESKDIGKLKVGYELLQQEIQELRKRATEEKGIKVLESLRSQIVELTGLLNSERRLREETELKMANLKTLSATNEVCLKCNELKSKNELLLKKEQAFMKEIDGLRNEILELKENALNRSSRRNSATLKNDGTKHRGSIVKIDEGRQIIESELLKIRQSSVENQSFEHRRMSVSQVPDIAANKSRQTPRSSVHERTIPKVEAAPANDNINWNSTWDEEDDSSEASGSVNDVSSSSTNVKSLHELDRIQEDSILLLKEVFY